MGPGKVDYHFARIVSVVLVWLPFLTFKEVGFHFACLASSFRLSSSLFAAAEFLM